ncbi:MAG: hypothetical protein ACOC53_07940, partial [Candidatus Saliniplasma sp.]
MTDIGVYTSIETLEEKIGYAEDSQYYVWWRIQNSTKMQKILENEGIDKMFFAAAIEWKGYFTVEKTVTTSHRGIKIYLNKWHELEEKP